MNPRVRWETFANPFHVSISSPGKQISILRKTFITPPPPQTLCGQSCSFAFHTICIIMKSPSVTVSNPLNIPHTAHWPYWTYCFTNLHNWNRPCFWHYCWFCNEFSCYTKSVSSLMECGQFKNTQRPQKLHSEHDNRIKPTFRTASFLWQLHFSNYHAHIKFYKTSSVNLPFTDEVSINTTVHPSVDFRLPPKSSLRLRCVVMPNSESW
jgi:hypothetical protein